LLRRKLMKKLLSAGSVLLIGLFYILSGAYAQEAPYRDVTPTKAYEMVTSQAGYLIDVRSPEEWDLVGHPGENKKGQGREMDDRVFFIPWNSYSGQSNPDFLAKVKQAFPDPNTPLLFICRSGGRSVSAAKAVHAAGYKNIYNVTSGFEGDLGPEGYRNKNGWKVDGLPYRYGKPLERKG
jgi:rhodanese-related sulfurtransferase